MRLLLHDNLPDNLLAATVGLHDLVYHLLLLLLLLIRLLVNEQYLALLPWLMDEYRLGLLVHNDCLMVVWLDSPSPTPGCGCLQVKLAC